MSPTSHRRVAPRRQKKKTAGESAGVRSLLSHVLLSLLLTALVGLCLLSLSAALLLKARDPGRLSLPAATLLCYLTALFGGMLASRLHGRRTPVLVGGALGLLLLLLLLLVSAIAPESGAAALPDVWRHVIRFTLTPVTVLGALLAARKKQRRRRK